jgi:hypothetical protein
MKHNLFALFGSVAVLLTATAATIAASAQAPGAQTSGTQQSPITQPTPGAPMIQQQDQTIQDRTLERLQVRAEEEEDLLDILD